MRGLFDAIDQPLTADSAFVIIGTLVVVLIAERAIRELEFRYRAAIERIDGYIHGFRDGEAHRMPAADVEVPAKVPAAFIRGMR